MTKSLSQLIKEKKFDWVNPDITKENFPVQEGDGELKEYKLYSFGKDISSEDAIAEMKKDGYSPATLRDLLNWDDWNGEDLVVSLGSVWRDFYHDNCVPLLHQGGSGHELGLGLFKVDWSDYWRFLAVRKSLGASDSQTLELLDLDGEIIEIKGVKYTLKKYEPKRNKV